MVRSQARRAFTLIELLTVIAIIAILTAILFPVAGTVREQARASSCMSNLHQLWVSANVYRQDEGGFPPALLGYVEESDVNPATGQCDRTLTKRLPWTSASSCPPAYADATVRGFLYREQIKDLNIFRCPDNQRKDKSEPVRVYFPPRPSDWPTYPGTSTPYGYIGDYYASLGCPTEGPLGTLYCDPASKEPIWHYAVDSYDISPAIDPATGAQILRADGSIGYQIRYFTDWTGPTRSGSGPNGQVGSGQADMPYQLKYENPPDDKTLFTFCSWHQAIAKTGTVPAINMAGSAKKINISQALSKSAALFAR
jgi:prepilin-type N-terminal cleavage/methylation domain-containing protein